MAIVDLFCGCGGLSKGFEQAGFDIVASYDSWDSAITCYNANFQTHKAVKLDLGNVEETVQHIGTLKPTMIIGGPPCQEFSNAGKRQEGERADLTYKYAQIITEIKPRFFVMENVPRVRESKAYSKARELYLQSGYGLTEVVLDASKCGVPQRRKRFFCIGGLNEAPNFLLDDIFNASNGKECTVREYFQANGIELNIDAYYRHPTTYSRRAVFSVDEVAPTVRGVNRPRPSTYKHHEQDAVAETELANIRHLSIKERATIQTFPPEFQFENLGLSKGDVEQMVGNAVPVKLAQFIAERIKAFQDGTVHTVDTNTRFADWLREKKNYSDRSISDVFSRLSRAAKLLSEGELGKYSVVDLVENEQYNQLSPSVRSQIKKAIQLKYAFDKEQETNG